MKLIRISTLVLIYLFFIGAANAQMKPTAILNSVLTSFNNGDGISAQIRIVSKQQSQSGTISMSKNKYSLQLGNIKIWYNGTTMWSYSKDTNEVNVTNPSQEELQTSNPYAAVASASKDYKISSLKSTSAAHYSLRLLPKRQNDLREIVLEIEKSTFHISKMTVVTVDGNTITTHITKYKTKNKFGNDVFTFNKKYVPTNAYINDLR